MIDFFNGATGMGCLLAAISFAGFYRQTADRLFLLFSLAFGTFAVNRAILALLAEGHEATSYVYLSRLLAFLLIIYGIVEKNRLGRS